MKPSRYGVFFEGRFLTILIEGCSGYLFLLERTLVVCIFQGIFLFHISCQIYRYKVVHNAPLLSFDIYRICDDVTPLIPNLSFFLDDSGWRLISFIDRLEGPVCGFIDFSLFFCFYFIDFCFGLYYSLFLLSFSLICSFSRFLKCKLRLLI